MNRKIQRLNHDTYTDGMLSYGKTETLYSDFNKKIGEDFIKIGVLFFDELSSRESDNVVADSIGYVIDKKVKVPLQKDIKKSYKVKIEDVMYDIANFDNDKRNTYLYLQRAGV